MSLNLSPEQIKALSQNLGHAEVLTTLTSYGAVPVHRQGELVRSIGAKSIGTGNINAEQVAVLEAMLAAMKAEAGRQDE